ncbi:MAG: hypothetical protein LBJ11_10020 [Oscillospiraceae bacterium]|jgi:hypothetical protein|nr:hypothetical protein [Oscillospiraceae bacterium]
MGKLGMLAERVRKMSFDRLRQNVNVVHLESSKSRAGIFLDMCWCAARYGVGYLDYNVFGFAYVRGKKLRRTYMTMNHNMRLVRAVNDPAGIAEVRNKITFNERYSDLLGRDWIDLSRCSAEEFSAFLEGKGAVFAKPTDERGGNGVERISLPAPEGSGALLERLRESGQILVEEAIVQHPEMSRLSPSSVNTLRVTSLLDGEQTHIFYCLVRMGDGTRHNDNISCGGMYCPVDDDGRISAPAFCDKTGLCYEEHPATHVRLPGFSIPYYAEAMDLIRRAAPRSPLVRYIGWDIAVTPAGPVLVEGNTVPSYDMCQNYRHLGKGGGILPKFQAAVNL